MKMTDSKNQSYIWKESSQDLQYQCNVNIETTAINGDLNIIHGETQPIEDDQSIIHGKTSTNNKDQNMIYMETTTFEDCPNVCVESILPEMWLKILGYLSQAEKCSLLLTCSFLYNVGSQPVVWSRCLINKFLVSSTTNFAFLTLPRFSLISRIDLSDSNVSSTSANSLFSTLPQLLNINHLNLSHTHLGEVPLSLLVPGLVNLLTLSLQNSRLSTQQLEEVIKIMPPNLSSLNLSNLDFTGVGCSLYNLTRLVRLNIAGCTLENSQLEDIFTILSQDGSNLSHLIIKDLDLSPINPSTLGSGISRLVSANLQGTKLGQAQCRAVIQAVVNGCGVLKSLNLNQICLSSVPADLLGLCIAKLSGRFCLNWSGLTSTQVTRLLERRPKKLRLELEGVNMRGVPSHLVAGFRFRSCLGAFNRVTGLSGEIDDDMS